MQLAMFTGPIGAAGYELLARSYTLCLHYVKQKRRPSAIRDRDAKNARCFRTKPPMWAGSLSTASKSPNALSKMDQIARGQRWFCYKPQREVQINAVG